MIWNDIEGDGDDCKGNICWNKDAPFDEFSNLDEETSDVNEDETTDATVRCCFITNHKFWNWWCCAIISSNGVDYKIWCDCGKLLEYWERIDNE